MTIDLDAVRADFPILAREVNGRRLVYLDTAATAQKPEAVIRAVTDYYRGHNANIHRGVHTLSVEATDLWDAARAAVARFVGAPSPESIVFVRNTTEAINLVAHAWARQVLRPGDEVVVSEMEHHANLVPWQRAAAETGARLVAIPVTDGGELDIVAAAGLIGPRTRLVAVGHVSNALGTINPAERLRELSAAVGARLLLDAAQSAPHLPLDVAALGCDFLAGSGHKLYGPTGIGFLYARPELLDRMEPMLTGGDMIDEVFVDHATWAAPPNRFEAGTPDIAGAVGLHAALDYLTALGMPAVRAHERGLMARALERLAAVPGAALYGPADPDRRSGAVSFTLDGVHPHDLGTFLDAEGIAVRTGHHCCQPLMRRLGLPGTVRASFGVYTAPEEVGALADALTDAARYFRHAA